MYAGVEELITAIEAADKAHNEQLDDGDESCCEVRTRVQNAAWSALAETTEEPLVRHIAVHVGPRYPSEAITVLRMLPCSMDKIDDLATREGWCGTYTGLLNAAEVAGVLPGQTPLSPERAALKQWFLYNYTDNRSAMSTLMDHVDAILNAERPIVDTAPTGDVDAVDVEGADNDQPAQV
jgi:hypothetical protein